MASAEVIHCYREFTAPSGEIDAYLLDLPLDGARPEVQIKAEIRRPDLVRDGLLVLGEVLSSDLRRQASDRADYLAYLLRKGKRATQAVWEAQKAFLAAKYGEATQQEAPLDPLFSVDGNGISIEAFSRDESTYARLHLKAGHAYQAEHFAAGTSHLNFTPPLLEALAGIRFYRPTILQGYPSTAGNAKTVRVPYRWLRAFGQVQAASTLPADRVRLAPVDLYNVLLSLRLRKAKTAPRALRYELVPGQAPRLVLEPWERVLTASGSPYQGNLPHVVRTWGRQRLSLLGRLLPHAKAVDVYLLGAGLPAFYVLDLEAASLTLALSGWTDSGWAGIATFDLLVPGNGDEVLAKRVVKQVTERPLTLDVLSETLRQPRQTIRPALLGELLKGTLVHDIASGLFHHRPLLAQPLELDRLRYRDAREEQAHRLLATKDQVQLTRIHDLGREGTTIDGEVQDRQAHRHYQTSFTLDREGRSVKASCTCHEFRRAGLKQGPCPHMIALRLRYAREQAALEQARETADGRRLIRAETRTLTRRQGETVLSYRISLDERQVLLHWGHDPRTSRQQRLLFNRAEEARDAYFARLDCLAKQGFIDASAA
ncbi:MAG: SWIM zinc finger family protein [Candidatus Contendobacter sp.]